MMWFGVIIVAIIVVAVACYYLWHKSDWRRRRRATESLAQSAGGWDDSARAALAELVAMDQPTAADRFARATIIEYNLHEGTAAAHAEAQAAVAEDYYNVLRNIHELPRPAFQLGRMGAFRGRIDAVHAPIVIRFTELFDTVEPAVAAATTAERVNRAAAAADTRAEAAEIFFDDVREFPEDTQNVHDSAMSSDLRETLRRLRADEPANSVSTPKALHEARQAIAAAWADDEPPYTDEQIAQRREYAGRVLARIEQGTSISTFGDTREDEIFTLVWNRARHPRNDAATVRGAVLDALVGSVEHDSVVCSNGRAARLISALTSVDYDPKISDGAMTTAAYKNQIFEEAKEILERALDAAAASDDADERAVAESYRATGNDTADPPDAAVARFGAKIKREIDDNIAQYSDKLPPAVLERLRYDCYAGVDIDVA